MENSFWNVCFSLNFYPYHELLHKVFPLLLAAVSDLMPNGAELLHFALFLQNAFSSKKIDAGKNAIWSWHSLFALFPVACVKCSIWCKMDSEQGKIKLGRKLIHWALIYRSCNISIGENQPVFFSPKHSSPKTDFLSEQKEVVATGNISCHRWEAACFRYSSSKSGSWAPGISPRFSCSVWPWSRQLIWCFQTGVPWHI